MKKPMIYILFICLSLVGFESKAFDFNPNCLELEIQDIATQCLPNDANSLSFSIVIDATEYLENDCIIGTFQINTDLENIVFIDVDTLWSSNLLTINGTVQVAACPYPNFVPIELLFEGTTPTPFSCVYPAQLTTLCCKQVLVEPKDYCKTLDKIEIPLLGCTSFCDVQSIKWFVQDAPCLNGNWGDPFQISNQCQPLLLSPQYHNGDVCVYAELQTGGADGSCTNTYTTNPVTIHFFNQIEAEINLDKQLLCYDSIPVTPQELQVNLLSQGSDYTIKWEGPRGPVQGATELTLQPSDLVFSKNDNRCDVTFNYYATLTDVCGEQQFESDIIVQKLNAPIGNLSFFYDRDLPLCYSGDATLLFEKKCTALDTDWFWSKSTDGENFEKMNDVGTQNTRFNTNRLYEDHWFTVSPFDSLANGCAVQPSKMFVPVHPELELISFTAEHPSPCNPYVVEMDVKFSPTYADTTNCNYTVRWFRDGLPIGLDVVKGGSASFIYAPLFVTDIEGNYYVEIYNNCCPEEELKSKITYIEAPTFVLINGPCFRCNDELIQLEGIVVNPKPGTQYSFQWYDENGSIANAIGNFLNVLPVQEGPFIFEMTSVTSDTTCTFNAIFNLLQCGSNQLMFINPYFRQENPEVLELSLYPNPTMSDISIEIPKRFEAGSRITIYDSRGQLVLEEVVPSKTTIFEASLGDLAVGTYYAIVHDKTQYASSVFQIVR